jgi:hypothetical protein
MFVAIMLMMLDTSRNLRAIEIILGENDIETGVVVVVVDVDVVVVV